MTYRLLGLLVVPCLIAAFAGPLVADDWPTYRHDVHRLGASAEALEPPLSQDWVFKPTFGPSRAWGDPPPKPVETVLELPRLAFDDAFHVAVVGGTVYFGSSADGKVYALDAANGAVRWEFHTDGPVRMAPTVAGGKVYVGSDDGRVYCLSAADGRPVWTFRAAPGPEMILGNGRMISVWPVRTGVAVEGGVAYFGAGIFPAEGLYLYAVGADDGQLRWKNDTYGRGGLAGISPQGYLVVSAERLFVPSGRAMPAAFDRATGRFLFHRNFNWRDTGLFGGTYTLLAGDLLLGGAEQLTAVYEKNGQLALNEGLAAAKPSEGTRRLVVADDTVYLLTGKEAVAFDRTKWIARRTELTQLKMRLSGLSRQVNNLKAPAAKDTQAAMQLKEVQEQVKKAVARRDELRNMKDDWTTWRVACDGADSVALAGSTLLVGGPGAVMALDAASGKRLWTAHVEGKARGLAVAGGRLFVSTDAGRIYAFVQGAGGKGHDASPRPDADPFPNDDLAKACAKRADEIVRAAGVKRGYALVLGDDGRLALELARRTDLVIYVSVPDAEGAAAARKVLSAAGVYGGKVVVMHHPPGPVPYADYFANLVVCDGRFFASPNLTPADEVSRLLKPCGGIAVIGKPPDDPAVVPAEVKAWLGMFVGGLNQRGEVQAARAGDWMVTGLGRLKGAGTWTHQYAEPGNTCCGDDQLVQGPIGILWFGEPGPSRMPSRHASNVSPLVVDGRLFVEGENVVMAYDAYNGLELWHRDMPGALRLDLKTRVSNVAAGPEGFFVAIGDQCQLLDAATGHTRRTYRTPAPKDAKKRNWRYVATAGGLLYGSTDGGLLFALDVLTSNVRWTHQAGNLMQTTLCMGSSKVFFVDRAVTEVQRKAGLEGIDAKARVDRLGKPVPPDVRLVVALDADTGKKAWEQPQYVADCVKVGQTGGELIAMVSHDVLLLAGQPWNGHFWQEFLAGEFSRRSLIALSAADGKSLWSGRKGYRSRPLIVGSQIIAEPWAHDLYSGAEQTREHPVTGATAAWQMARPGHHCGNIAAAPNALFFRSGSTAYYDLKGDYGTAHFGAQRPGCWVNCIPAGGLVVMPEASSGCVCPFAVHTTVVFKPRRTNRVWGMFSAPGPMIPVKHLAVNFGAPGDRKTSDGTLWLAYPRPSTIRLVLAFELGVTHGPGGGYFQRNADFLPIAGAADPWIYASGVSDLAQCTIPLDKPGAAPAAYTVRLLFADPKNEEPGRRVFDIKLQDKTVLEGFDLVKEAGGKDRAVLKEFKGIEAGENLILTLVPRDKQTTADSAPILSGIEIVRDQP